MDHDTSADAAGRTRTNGVGGKLINAGSYVLFALGIAALASFFAPYVGLAEIAWHSAYLPTIAAPTEGDAVVNVAPLILGVVVSSVAVWLR